jgi:hypothetical protein
MKMIMMILMILLNRAFAYNYESVYLVEGMDYPERELECQNGKKVKLLLAEGAGKARQACAAEGGPKRVIVTGIRKNSAELTITQATGSDPIIKFETTLEPMKLEKEKDSF